jgi:hypothetical protein
MQLESAEVVVSAKLEQQLFEATAFYQPIILNRTNATRASKKLPLKNQTIKAFPAAAVRPRILPLSLSRIFWARMTVFLSADPHPRTA